MLKSDDSNTESLNSDNSKSDSFSTEKNHYKFSKIIVLVLNVGF